MALTELDQKLLKRILSKAPGSWNDFVDRFLSLIYHTIHHTAASRSARLSPEDVEDIAAEVLVQLVADDSKALREFRGQATLATYIAVIARRTCVHEMTRRLQVREAIQRGDVSNATDRSEDSAATMKALEKLDDVEVLLRKLAGKEREIVRLFYLEGRSYEEISTEVDVPVNSIGSVLSRARAKLRELSRSNVAIPKLEKPLASPLVPKGKPKKPKNSG